MSTSTQVEKSEEININISNEFDKSQESNSFRKDYSEKMNSFNDTSKTDSLDSKNQISIPTEVIKINSRSIISILNQEINELKEKYTKIEEKFDKLKEQNKKMLLKMFNLIIIISKKNEEIESLKKQLHLNDNKNKDLILPVSLNNKANSTPLSLSVNPHQYNNNLINLSINTKFSNSEILKLNKAKSSKISIINFLKLKNIEQKNKSTNNPDKRQLQKALEEENQVKNKKIKLSDNAIKDFRNNYNIKENISKSEIIKALINNNYDQKEASIWLLLNNKNNESQ